MCICFSFFFHPWGFSFVNLGLLTEDTHLHSCNLHPNQVPWALFPSSPTTHSCLLAWGPRCWESVSPAFTLEELWVVVHVPPPGPSHWTWRRWEGWLYTDLSKSTYLPTSPSPNPQSRLLREAVFEDCTTVQDFALPTTFPLSLC